MRIALITDQHFGARNDSPIFANYFKTFYEEQFFPYLEEHNIKHIIELGDIFDRRKYVNYLTLKNCREYFFDHIKSGNYHLDMIIGNHCTFYKSTNKVNSPRLLLKEYSEYISIYDSPQDIVVDGLKIAIIPWICSGNYQESMEYIKSTTAQIAMGHLEIAGFEMYRGSVNDHGFDKHIFDKFDMAMSGHFHHKSNYGNIFYLGAPYEMNWSDWNDPRGFHIFDTDTRELTYIENRYKMFNKIHYDDQNTTLEQILDFDEEALKNHYVKVIVHNKNNPYWFDMFIAKLESIGVHDIQTVEDNFHLDLEDDIDFSQDIEDTITILNKFTEQFSDRVDIKKLNSVLHDLYHEALAVE